MSEPQQEGDAPTRPRRLAPQIRMAIATVIVLGFSGALLLFYRGAAPAGTLTGRVVGKASKVVLVDPKREIYREGTLDGAGGYAVLLPSAAREPLVVIHGAEGGTLVESPVDLKQGLTVPTLALWRTEVRLRTSDGKLRIDWGAIPEGEGLPKRRRYSILIRYRKRSGEQAEATLLSQAASCEIALGELKELMRDYDPQRPEVEVKLRAFDPSVQNGPLWVGRATSWTIPK